MKSLIKRFECKPEIPFSCFKARIQSEIWNAETFSPLSNTEFFPAIGNKTIIGSISLLNFHRNPPTVVWPISAFVIYAIYCIALFWFSHVADEVSKRFPSWGHINMLIMRMRIFRTALHGAPYGINTIMSPSVRAFTNRNGFVMPTSTTFCGSTKQMSNTNRMCISAITFTNPVTMRTALLSAYCYESSKSTASQIKWFCHAVIITQKALGWFNRVEINK